VLKETKQAKAAIAAYEAEERKLSDTQVLLDLAVEGDDAGTFAEARAAAAQIKAAIDDQEFHRMLSGEQDASGAVVQINSGAGGVDAADWAHMLLRMLVRYCQRHGWKCEIVDEEPAEEAGIKSATLVVEGEYAYGLLKAEMGVHRLVRISPFDGQARRQTSFAAVSVSPDIEEELDLEINDADLRVDVYRSGGAGGQHVNKTESAVRLTHLPTGLVVQCQNERSQHKNKAQAMRVLRSRLYDLRKREQDEKVAAANAQKKAIEWGSQIRSYVLHPYRQVTDHRTEIKMSDVDGVLDGDLDELIRTFLLQQASGPPPSAN
jgi:peptide chain release factor 2